ncbi:hypothetical protein J2W30_005794 [Variovorax boronicumulans]|nr:hypothetical protein [Variovorax boronicumulans]
MRDVVREVASIDDHVIADHRKHRRQLAVAEHDERTVRIDRDKAEDIIRTETVAFEDIVNGLPILNGVCQQPRNIRQIVRVLVALAGMPRRQLRVSSNIDAFAIKAIDAAEKVSVMKGKGNPSCRSNRSISASVMPAFH